MSDLDRLRDVGQLLRPPAFEELLETRRRRTRRARIATASTLAVATTAAVVILAATGNNLRTNPPPVGPSLTPTATPTETLQFPAGQQTITPDIGPDDVRGFDVLATVTNAQPGHRGDSELSATVTIHTEYQFYATYCRGKSDLWFNYDIGDGGGGTGRCSPDADTTLTLDADIDQMDAYAAESRTVRMWITRPSAAYIACLHSYAGDCSGVGAPQPIASPNAEFGFRIYEHQAPVVLQLLEDQGNSEPFEALSSIDGVAWLVDRAVVAAPDADRLAFELPASDSDYLVDVYTGNGPHLERCRAQHADELPDWFADRGAYEAAFNKICGVDLRLEVDGTTVSPDQDPHASGHFTELGAELAPGVDHQIVVEVVRGDPRNIQYAVVVRTRTQMP